MARLPFLRKAKNLFSKPRDEGPPPFKPVDLPRVKKEHQFSLADQGWVSITYDNENDPLKLAYQALLEASKRFFDQPVSEKEKYKTSEGTEEGWKHVPGEKEFITLRTINNTPTIMQEAAKIYWLEAGDYLDNLIGGVAQSLGLKKEALTVYSEPCSRLGEEKTATMLRIFRYYGFEGEEDKIVAEPHRDLGLISMSSGDTPGLEVWDQYAQLWYPLERDFPAGTLMVGRQLEILTNGRYCGGAHLVRAHPDPNASKSPEKKYRHSIVFVLRAHSPVPIDTDKLTTAITGQFNKPLRDDSAGELFKRIHKAAYNINTDIEIREKQKKRLQSVK